MLLSAIGGAGGLAVGIAIVLVTQWALPAMPARISPLYVVLALVIAVSIGLVAGVLPARDRREARAARRAARGVAGLLQLPHDRHQWRSAAEQPVQSCGEPCRRLHEAPIR